MRPTTRTVRACGRSRPRRYAGSRSLGTRNSVVALNPGGAARSCPARGRADPKRKVRLKRCGSSAAVCGRLPDVGQLHPPVPAGAVEPERLAPQGGEAAARVEVAAGGRGGIHLGRRAGPAPSAAPTAPAREQGTTGGHWSSGPPGSGTGQGNSIARVDEPRWLTFDLFAGRVGEQFVVSGGRAARRSRWSWSRRPRAPSRAGAGPRGSSGCSSRWCSAGRPSRCCRRRPTRSSHDALGELELFLVPIGPDARGHAVRGGVRLTARRSRRGPLHPAVDARPRRPRRSRAARRAGRPGCGSRRGC